ncbi:MAG: thymidine phosphorylase [Sulfitobacter sp.]
MNAQSILAKLRHAETLTPDDLTWAAGALADQTFSAAQAGAFAMGICRNGLDEAGRVALTRGMCASGQVLTWDLDKPVLDKHSTGGVGDCVSLVLAPALAACGAYVPMISGRGLGHTGGTLDKLEAIPGVNVMLDEARLRSVVQTAGCAIVGATGDIAPADKRLYAVRDVTSTVDSLDLITASILSKKLAAGLEGLVLDVKVGSGAFMKDIGAARDLARALVGTANAAGCPTQAIISDMGQPLVPSLGNALEVAEVMRVLTGSQQGAIVELCAALGGVLLAGAGLAQNREEGATKIIQVISSGEAADRFGAMIAALGGPVQFVEHWRRFLPEATVVREVTAQSAGVVQAMDAQALGEVVVALGGGRLIETDTVDPAVGLSEVVRIGTRVEKGQPLAVVHAARSQQADRAADALRAAITLGAAGASPDLIVEHVV